MRCKGEGLDESCWDNVGLSCLKAGALCAVIYVEETWKSVGTDSKPSLHFVRLPHLTVESCSGDELRSRGDRQLAHNREGCSKRRTHKQTPPPQ